jgi:hypothetical protein
VYGRNVTSARRLQTIGQGCYSRATCLYPWRVVEKAPAKAYRSRRLPNLDQVGSMTWESTSGDAFKMIGCLGEEGKEANE